MLEQSYWNNTGKYNQWAKDLSGKGPMIGTETNNPAMNAFLETVNLYYDYYNNGGCNLTQDSFDSLNELVKEVSTQTGKTLPQLKGKYFVRDVEGDSWEDEDDYYYDEGNTYFDDTRLSPETLEAFVNSLFEVLQDVDMSYTQYACYRRFGTLEASMTPVEGFDYHTWDNQERMDNEMHRYTFLS